MDGRNRSGGAPAGAVVHKYGGSSLASLEDVRRVAERVRDRHHAEGPLVVVVSARGGTTDDLLRTARELGTAHGCREVDQLLATGENASAATLALALHRLGVPAVSLSGPQAGITVEGRHGEGMIDAFSPVRVRDHLDGGATVVVAGFQGEGRGGDVQTLGRGGSDTTAVALTAALDAPLCEIRTDVDGVYTADPRIVPDAHVLAHVPGEVMAEMAYAGSRVLHSRSVELAAARGVAIRVRHASGRGPGSLVGGTPATDAPPVAALAHDPDTARLLIRGGSGTAALASDLLRLFAERSVRVDLVGHTLPSQDRLRLGCTLRTEDLPEIIPALRSRLAAAGAELAVDEHVGKVSLVADRTHNMPGLAATALRALREAGIPVSWVSASPLRASAVVPRERTADAVRLLHDLLGLARSGEPATSLAPV
ncbi:aspartate kinase [Streptomonospora arabica]|uniref:Aspartokinase n=1 Tax=Streptomonospora arabica TaxID=412417 RepID=A0ABV9SLK1_9ACTN